LFSIFVKKNWVSGGTVSSSTLGTSDLQADSILSPKEVFQIRGQVEQHHNPRQPPIKKSRQWLNTPQTGPPAVKSLLCLPEKSQGAQRQSHTAVKAGMTMWVVLEEGSLQGPGTWAHIVT
jgi:hypothetical protein